MKKLLAGLLITTSLIYTPQADAKTVSACKVPGKIYMSKSIHNNSDLKLINTGKYQWKAIKLGNSLKYAQAKLGKAESSQIIKDHEGTTAVLNYGDYSLVFYSEKRYVKHDTLKLQGLMIGLDGNKRILKRDIEAVIGAPKYKNVMVEDEKLDIYNYMSVHYDAISKGKIADSVIMMHPKFLMTNPKYNKDNVKVNKLKKVAPKKLTTTELKAMNKGKFSYRGIKFGMTPTSVYKAIGQSNSDEYIVEEDTSTLSQYYGIGDWLNVDYTSDKCDDKFNADYLSFDYSKLKVTEKDIRAALGKPTDSYTDKYEDDESTGKMIYSKELYYDHVSVTLEKIGKTYYVESIDVTAS